MKSQPSNFHKILYSLTIILFMIPLLGNRPKKPDMIGPTTIYVDTDAVGPTFDGTSWANAFKYLQDALDSTYLSSTTDYEIWVAEGVYYPDDENIGTDHTDNSPSESFQIKYDNVKLYGGFAGTESILEDRDWITNPTILSGDIDGNDSHGGDFIADDWNDISGSNAYHVVTFNEVVYEAITNYTTLDGFTITAGSANNSGLTSSYGGGMYCFAASLSPAGVCSPTLRNLIVQGNYAEIGGGMMLYTSDEGASSPNLTNVSFINNFGLIDGGGFYSYVANHSSCESIPVMVNTKFYGNRTDGDGGGIHIFSADGTNAPILTNVEFYDNSAVGYGGGIYSWGNNGNVQLIFNNVTFSKNEADHGGGIFNSLTTSAAHSFVVEMNNTILWDNTGTTSHPEIYNINVTPLISSSDIKECIDGGGVWDSSCGFNNGGNIDENPQFVNASSGILSLQDTSPAIDAGNQSLLPNDVTDLDQDNDSGETLPLDLAMNNRVENADVDMGAYEHGLITDNDKVGFYAPDTKIWRMRTGNTWSDSVNYLVWGPNGGGWTPVTGDWDNDGIDEVGFYDPVTNIWRMRTGNTWSDSVNYLVWGPNGGGWTPVTGDWDNDGVDEVGFYDPATKIWRMKTENTWSGSVSYLVWGPNGGGWTPVTGDWDDDGVDEVGFYDPATKIWRMRTGNAWSDSVNYLVWGPNGGGWTPVTGDWDSDGIDEVGFYDPATKIWRMRTGNTWSDSVNYLVWGPNGGGWTPVTGKW